MKCPTGCSAYHGGEIKHIKECVFYPESLTKLNEDKINKLHSRIKELEAVVLELYNLADQARRNYMCEENAVYARELYNKHKDLIGSITKDER